MYLFNQAVFEKMVKEKRISFDLKNMWLKSMHELKTHPVLSSITRKFAYQIIQDDLKYPYL